VRRQSRRDRAHYRRVLLRQPELHAQHAQPQRRVAQQRQRVVADAARARL
jgi:hypothetical protein